MSLHFLIDGYNIIKQTPSLNRGTLENQRSALLTWINSYKPQGSSQNQVTVVFDGKTDIFGHEASFGAKVIFSKGQSADDVIKKIIEQSQSKKNWVVVSDDKDIKLYVRALGAQVLTVKEFTRESGSKTKRSSQDTQATTSKYISLTAQAKINKELEDIWVNPKGKLKP